MRLKRWQVVAVKNNPFAETLGEEVMSTHFTRRGARRRRDDLAFSIMTLRMNAVTAARGLRPMLEYEIRHANSSSWTSAPKASL